MERVRTHQITTLKKWLQGENVLRWKYWDEEYIQRKRKELGPWKTHTLVCTCTHAQTHIHLNIHILYTIIKTHTSSILYLSCFELCIPQRTGFIHSLDCQTNTDLPHLISKLTSSCNHRHKHVSVWRYAIKLQSIASEWVKMWKISIKTKFQLSAMFKCAKYGLVIKTHSKEYGLWYKKGKQTYTVHGWFARYSSVYLGVLKFNVDHEM